MEVGDRSGSRIAGRRDARRPELTPFWIRLTSPIQLFQSVLQEADRPDTSLVSEITKALKPGGNGHTHDWEDKTFKR